MYTRWAFLVVLAVLWGADATRAQGHESHEGHAHEAHEQNADDDHSGDGGHEDHGHEDSEAGEHDDADAHEEHGHEDHATHDHEHENAASAERDHADYEGHDHGTHEEGVLQVSKEGQRMVGLTIAEAGMRRLVQTVELAGETGFNEDRLAHITPRFGGVVKRVLKRQGQYVRTGDLLAVIENNETFVDYGIRAPFSGTIVDKHLTAGEFVSEESTIYVLVDLGTVWVTLDVYPRDVAAIKRGQTVTVAAVGAPMEAEAEVSYVAPVFDVAKRSAVARAVLRNADGLWRPGMFVRGLVHLESTEEVLAVENDAVQSIDGETVVFVPAGEDAFRAVPVTAGVRGESHTAILTGLAASDRYVSKGAFDLKAEIVTSSLDSHAGHGH